MPKDEFDPEDPMELFGVGLVTEEDTTEAMTECFIEEFMRLGYNHKQILALFRNHHYTGMNMVLQNRGEPFILDHITETFAKWGHQISWPDTKRKNAPANDGPPTHGVGSISPSSLNEPSQPCAVDPMGGAVPQEILNVSFYEQRL